MHVGGCADFCSLVINRLPKMVELLYTDWLSSQPLKLTCKPFVHHSIHHHHHLSTFPHYVWSIQGLLTAFRRAAMVSDLVSLVLSEINQVPLPRKIPWRLSNPQKRRQRKRLKLVDKVVATVDSALQRQNMELGRNVIRWKEEMPTEQEMRPKDKYTIFDRKEKKYRKSIRSKLLLDELLGA